MRAWTPQQLAVIHAIVHTKDNYNVNAVAGSGKTTTIGQAAMDYVAEHPTHRVLMCAFNKRIAEELAERYPHEQLHHKTFNGLGHGAWSKHYGGYVKVETKKNWNILREWIKDDSSPDASRLMGMLKQSGWLPPIWRTRLHVSNEVDDRSIIEGLCEDFELDLSSELDWPDIMDMAICASIDQANAGLIDFDDQLYMPTLFGAAFPQFNLVIVDEVQDVSWIQRRMIRKCLGASGRVCGVGDRNQAIYAFRGAGFDSMDHFKKDFRCLELPLSVSFRCPKSVVAVAQDYVPQIEAAADAEEGSVEDFESFPLDKENLTPTTLVICRNNKPLVPLAFKAIRAGIPAKMLGRDIGEGLAALIRKIQKGNSFKDCASLIVGLQAWAAERQRTLLAKDKEAQAAAVMDRIETIIAIAESVEPSAPPRLLETKVLSMFTNDTSRLTFSTIHKAKGLEWDRVIFLDSHLIPSKYAKTEEAIQQEMNCAYVAVTRARRQLIYAPSPKDTRK